jgi:hypothetical protein
MVNYFDFSLQISLENGWFRRYLNSLYLYLFQDKKKIKNNISTQDNIL